MRNLCTSVYRNKDPQEYLGNFSLRHLAEISVMKYQC